jgi:hypothetical protein
MKYQSKQIAAAFSILVALALGLGSARAQAQTEEPAPLNRRLATQLIADFYEIGESEVKIAYIVDGKLKTDGFETERGAEVTYIRPVIQDGRRRRLVQRITFLHDVELGWFLRAIIQDDGRDYIDICSEFQGRIRIE